MAILMHGRPIEPEGYKAGEGGLLRGRSVLRGKEGSGVGRGRTPLRSIVVAPVELKNSGLPARGQVGGSRAVGSGRTAFVRATAVSDLVCCSWLRVCFVMWMVGSDGEGVERVGRRV